MNAIALMLLTAGSAATPAQDKLIPKIEVERRPDMVIKWNEITLQAIKADRSPPPVAARTLAIVHLSIYDAVMAIERTHQPYLVDATPAANASVEAAVAAAAHRVLVTIYPKQKEILDATIRRCLEDLPRNHAALDAGVELGRAVAERMLAARCNDGAERKARYVFREEPGKWLPTAPHFHDALLPGWGDVDPFAIKKYTQYQPPGPPRLNSEAYTAAFHEVKRLGGKDSKHRTEDQTQIAYFWADDLGTVTPPGHWNRIAQSLAMDRGNTLADNARLFAHLNISMSDAAVLCWVIKFTFEFWRPITAIQQADRDGNPNTHADRDWTSLLVTPPFPAYVSGHSTFSSAGAAVLIHAFGNETRFKTDSESLPGVTRKFDTIWSAAQEAGMSRIYGGIHWQFDNVDGLNVGRHLGDYVVRNTLLPRTRNNERRALYPPTIIGK